MLAYKLGAPLLLFTDVFPGGRRGVVKHLSAPRKSNSEVGRSEGRRKMPIMTLPIKENVEHDSDLDAVSEGEDGGPHIKKKVLGAPRR